MAHGRSLHGALDEEGVGLLAAGSLGAAPQPHRQRRLYLVRLVAAGLLGAAFLAGSAGSSQRRGGPTASLRLQGTQLEEAELEEAEDADGDVDKGSKAVVTAEAAASCENAVVGDPCYRLVVWAMTTGIREHPEWYKNLTKKSKFEDFQANVHNFDAKKCPKPCPNPAGCETAEPGSACFRTVSWSMSTGVAQHPDWYKGLTAASPFEDFQRNVHDFNRTECPTPCNAQPFEAVSLFCWAAMRTDGYEMGIMQEALKKKAGIFACDGQAVVSDKEVAIGDDSDGSVKSIAISTLQSSGYTKDGTVPNAPIFIEAWEAVRGAADAAGYDWMVKVDPDTVLLPDRLRASLSPAALPQALLPRDPYPPPYQSAVPGGYWVPNCDKMASWGGGWGDGWPMMYGSVEILSRPAMEAYYAGLESCKGAVSWQGMGEDAFMGICMRHLQIGELFLKQGDGNCGPVDCADTSKAAFHPKKSASEWMACLAQAER